MIEALRRVPSVVGFFGIIVIVPIICLANITSITYTPSPIVVGWPAYYTINVASGDSPLNYSFSYQCTSGSGTGWSNPDMNGTGVFGYNEICTGNQNIKGGEQLMVGFNQQWNYLTNGITISPPDTEAITAGLNTDSTYDSDGAPLYDCSTLHVHFSISVGATVVGPYADVEVEERIRRPQYSFDSGWVGSSGDYYWENMSGYIDDVKTVGTGSLNGGPDWSSISVGTVFDDFYQQNRVWINDCTNTAQVTYFTERHFQKTKTSATTWKLTEL